MSDLLNHFRNLLIYQVSKGDLKLLEVSEAEAGSLREQSAMIGVEVLTRVMEVLTDAEGQLRNAASKKIFIEVALLKAIQARNAVSIDTVLQQLGQMRAGGSGSAAVPETAPAKQASKPAGQQASGLTSQRPHHPTATPGSEPGHPAAARA